MAFSCQYNVNIYEIFQGKSCVPLQNIPKNIGDQNVLFIFLENGLHV